jgi:hypothetical protein
MKDLENVKPSELKAKRLFPYKIKHPYSSPEKEIDVTLEQCTVHKNIPYGLAIINYEDPDYSSLSFKGTGIFNEGKLHMTQFSCITGRGWGYQIMNM